MDIRILVGASALIQFAAAGVALRLIRVTGTRVSWILVASAITLMGIGRTITLLNGLTGDVPMPLDPVAESVALLISILMLIGLAKIGPFFRSVHGAYEDLAKRTRAYRTLSAVNQVMLHSVIESELLHAACRAIVEVGGYRLAWVGFSEDDDEKTVHPVAQAGYEAGYLDTVDITWADSERGWGPMGTAIREGVPWVVQHILEDPRFEPWRSEATERGYASVAAFPMIVEGSVFGALAVYAEEANAFGPEEVTLLTELASDLAHGITVLRTRAEREQTEAELRRTHEALRQSERRLAVAQEIARLGSWDWNLETGEELWSDELYRILGYEPHEVPASYEGFVQMIHPDDRERVARTMEKAVAGSRDFHKADFRIVRRDGEVRFLRAHGMISRNEAGKPANLRGTMLDWTEEAEKERELRRSEAEYRALFENAPYGICRTSAEDRFHTVNPALVRMLGYESAEELKASKPSAVYRTPAERKRLWERHRGAEHIEEPDLLWKRKDGTPITVQLRGRRLPARDQEPETYEWFVDEVTDQRNLEAQLRQAQKMEAVGELTGGIAHDFNNILTIIASNAEFIDAALPDELEGAHSDLKELQSAVERGVVMIKKLMGFSRREKLAMEPVEIGDLVASTTRVLVRLLPETIVVRASTSAAQCVVRADRGALEQILMNLATNARDAMPRGGTLSIEVCQEKLDPGYHATHPWVQPGDYCRIDVRDTGIGMDEETKQKLFEPFFTTKGSGEGTGLGMAIIYGLVKQHRGFVHVYSEPNQGTEVKLYFPLLESDEAVQATTPVSHESLPRGTETVLLVEDEDAVRRAARRALEAHGYSVLAAADGEEAVEVFRAHEAEIDLIMADLVMPKLGGRQLRDALRGQGKEPKFLFTSGYSSDELREGSTLEPGTPFVQKPWMLADLLGRIREALDG